MNAKLAKRLRAQVNEAVAPFGLTVRYRDYAQLLVKSRRNPLVIKNTQTGEEHKGANIQVRMQKDCPRHVYKRLKRYVTRKSI